MTTKRIDGGVDYLRVTSTDTGEQNKMAEEYERIRKEDAGLGYKEYNGGAFGFMGKVTRHALCAQKGEWRMFQVSGKRAKTPFSKFGGRSQATRIDVQFTVQYDDGKIAEHMQALHDAALNRKKKEGKPAKIKGITEDGQMQTVYIGKRASDWYFRIYDKYAESKDEAYRNCIRFEVEIKGRACKSLWQYICQNGYGQAFLLGVLEQKFGEYGIEIPDQEGWGRHEWRQPREKKAIEATMAWLERAVAPSVLRVSCELGWLQPLITIMGDVLSEEESLDVCEQLAVRWGS